MNAIIVHDSTGKILSVALTNPAVNLRPVPAAADQTVLVVDAKELGVQLGSVDPFTTDGGTQACAAFAKIRDKLRVDVHARRLVRS
jgi:hypothetical protein